MIVALGILLPLVGAVAPQSRGKAVVVAVLVVELALALGALARHLTATLTALDLTLALTPAGFGIVVVAATGALLGVLATSDRSDAPVSPARALAALSATLLAIAGAGHLVGGALGLALVGVVGGQVVPDGHDRREGAGRRLVVWLTLAGAALVLADALGALGQGSGGRPPVPGLGGVISTLFVVGIAVGLGAVPFFLWLPGLAARDPARAAVVVTLVGSATLALGLAQAGAAPWLFDPGGGRAGLAAIGGGAAVLSGSVALGAKHPASAVAYLFAASSDLALAGFVLVPPAGVGALGWMLACQVLAAALALTALAGLGRRLSGGLRRRPLLAISVVVALFSLVGLPPTAGFVARSLVADAAGGAAAFVGAAALASVVGGLAVVRAIAPLLDRSDAPSERPGPLDAASLALAVVLLVLGVVPGPILSVLGAGS